MNIEPLKAVTRSRWSFVVGIWRCRETIISLCRIVEEQKAAKDDLHLAKLELTDTQKRLETERTSHARSKRHVEAMWRFIATRHRLEIPATEGSIRKILQEAERR